MSRWQNIGAKMNSYIETKQIPHSRIIKIQGKNKVCCDECNEFHRTHSVSIYQGRIICTECKKKLESTKSIDKVTIPIKFRQNALVNEAIKKTYIPVIKGSSCILVVPQCLIGKELKLVVLNKKKRKAVWKKKK